MNKFISGVIAGATVSAVANVAMNSVKPAQPKKDTRNISKTLHSLGDMAENISK